MTQEPERLSGSAYVVGGLSFIPLIGVLFGVVAILWGLLTSKAGGKTLALIGAAGIVFTIAVYSALFYFGFMYRGGIYDDLRARQAQGLVTELVRVIEFYKVQHGHYPESLETLRGSVPSESPVFIFDPMDVNLSGPSRQFHYQVVDADHYYLLGVGWDGVPFTADDVRPKVDVAPGSKIGLLVKE